MISPKALKVYIKNIIFRGDQILNNQCTDDYCLYCAIFSIYDSYIEDQYLDTFTQEQYLNYPQNCSLYNDHVLFSFINSLLSNSFEDIKLKLKF